MSSVIGGSPVALVSQPDPTGESPVTAASRSHATAPWRARLASGLLPPSYTTTGDATRLRRLIWLRAVLFPVAECAERNTVALGKLLLREMQLDPQEFDARKGFHARKLLVRQRLSIGVSDRGRDATPSRAIEPARNTNSRAAIRLANRLK